MRRTGTLRLGATTLAVTAVIGCSGGGQIPGPSSASPAPHSGSGAASATPVNPAARAAGLVDVRTVVPDAIIDLRYATTDNFVGMRLYPANARCLVHESMRPGLRAAAAALRSAGRGERLVFWDCYRPHSVQQRMYKKVSNPAWVAAPGPYSRSHESGRSVDVTLAVRRQHCPAARRVGRDCLVEMGTGFDSFTSRATAYATDGVSPAARASRARLRTAMGTGGLRVYSGEWWHFDGPGADVRRPVIDAPPT
ncbi:D-alanyl-D-alanine dipeptidase [Gordonia amarae]|uniref:D-alanyl-D-alanine dipeptidase n=2 Tax=Gordonia amarae TaxID=36821 RepID=G7GVR4_9ACTN|nr:M15 family metallopeptidase [Gordonia amarae]MCS3878767.1 D-alanyl-D-alanine dipeptidase [Gordonia amarae]QHN17342.1 D-alanyl-D-alanine dipeptidase [Gordonia amarae]QHN21868.1 D-alanyl-D-alanine dipeptidase [Gordonia amarae]QHN30718.1 D-alanyl-D-alanine dipeptidase [Gordonia amarae]QHN39494.1 D-alanyl-D-alanine dipeptidase [Gordonia amarae]